MYEPRTYRRRMENGRFSNFTIQEEETDLWIGINDMLKNEEIRNAAKGKVSDIRKQLKRYIKAYPEFLNSHDPLSLYDHEPPIIQEMKNAAIKANTGPMAAVAGSIAMSTLDHLDERFPLKEIVIENGGDIAVKINHPLIIDPFAGENRYFGNLGIEISLLNEKLAICASSGTFGHSFSYGKADLVVTISTNAALADAWATRIANNILIGTDVEKLTKALPAGILAVLAVKEDKMGYRGPFSMVSL